MRIRRKMRRAHPVPAVPVQKAGPNPCRACGTPGTRRKVVTNRKSGKTAVVRKCRACGHVAIPRNLYDYASAATSVADFGEGLMPRFGTEEVPGREFGMATL